MCWGCSDVHWNFSICWTTGQVRVPFFSCAAEVLVLQRLFNLWWRLGQGTVSLVENWGLIERDSLTGCSDVNCVTGNQGETNTVNRWLRRLDFNLASPNVQPTFTQIKLRRLAFFWDIKAHYVPVSDNLVMTVLLKSAISVPYLTSFGKCWKGIDSSHLLR